MCFCVINLVVLWLLCQMTEGCCLPERFCSFPDLIFLFLPSSDSCSKRPRRHGLCGKFDQCLAHGPQPWCESVSSGACAHTHCISLQHRYGDAGWMNGGLYVLFPGHYYKFLEHFNCANPFYWNGKSCAVKWFHLTGTRSAHLNFVLWKRFDGKPEVCAALEHTVGIRIAAF